MGIASFLKRLVTWWDGQTLGTQFFTWRHGLEVGQDTAGNRFYHSKDGKRRWVIYNGEAEASRVSPDWHGWLHHTWDEPPTKAPLRRRAWEKPHVENLTGTPRAYAPPGSIRRAEPAERRDYEPLDAGRRLMAENAAEVAVGAAVLAIAAGFVIYAGQITGFGGTGGGYDLRASFRSAEGVSVGTDVRLAGVKVGTVTHLALNPETFRADTTLALDEAVRLPDDSAAIIASEGLLGGSFVELVPGGSLLNLEPGAEIEDTQGAVSLLQLLLRYVAGGEGAE